MSALCHGLTPTQGSKDAGELLQLLLHPIPLNHFAYTPPPNLSPIYELCIFNHIPITPAITKIFLLFQAGHIIWEKGTTAAVE